MAQAPGLSEPAAPAKLAVRGQHLPGLDGLRAIAISAVLAFHLGLLSHNVTGPLLVTGGFLGVDLFFVLSGFLITSLLLEERLATGRIALGAFWARRARRLLPALVAMLLLVILAAGRSMALHSTLGTEHLDLGQLRWGGLAALAYVANWLDLHNALSPFASFAADSPFSHCWSLAIEEQFYLLWPLVVVAVLTLAKGRWRQWGLGLTALLGTASALAMAKSPLSIDIRPWGYFATTARAYELLIGAALALLVAGRPQPGPRLRRVLGIAAPLGLLGIGWYFWHATTTWGIGYGGGFVGFCLLVALVIADVAQVRPSPTARVLSIPPLRGLGRISYGVYLYHWPVFLLLPTFVAWTGTALNLGRLGITFAIALLSYFLLERPLMSKRLSARWALTLIPVGVAVAAVVLVVATIPSVALGPTSNLATASPRTPSGSLPGSGGLGPGRWKVDHVVDAAHPLRVLVYGGRPTYDLVPSLEAALGHQAAIELTIRATDPGTDAPAADYAGQQLALALSVLGTRPDVIVIMESPTDASYLLNDSSAPAAMAKDLVGLSRLGHVAGVLVPGYPGWLAPQPGGGEAQVAWTSMARQAQLDSGGKLRAAPVEDALRGPTGDFPAWLPPVDQPTAPRSSWQRVQMVDNTGLCPEGAVRYVAAIAADLEQLTGHGRAPAGWWQGSWRSASQSFAPPSWCPADSPAHPSPVATGQ